MNWTNIFLALTAAVLLFFLYRNIKGNPQAFSKANLSKSVSTLGVLALFLIGFIALLILILK